MEDLNLLLFNKLREYDRFMRMNRAPGALLSVSNSDSMDSPAFQRDIVLVLLSGQEEGMSQRQLAEQMRISPSTLSAMLDKLEADGYLTRGNHHGDKRVKLLTLTEMGTKRAEEVHQQCTMMRKSLYRNLTVDEKKELIRLLNKILDSGKEEKAPELEDVKQVTSFKIIGEGMTCGPDGCYFG